MNVMVGGLPQHGIAVCLSRDSPRRSVFSSLAALAAVTTRVRLGHIVACTGCQAPDQTTDMIETIDAISASRVGRDTGGIQTEAGPACVPIIVGDDGKLATWRLAARYADELNLDGPTPDQVRSWMPVIRSRCDSGQPTVGTGFEFEVIVAAVLGGTSLAGGIGSVPKTLVGALIIGILANAMNLLGVAIFWQPVVQGTVLIVAVAVAVDMALREGGRGWKRPTWLRT